MSTITPEVLAQLPSLTDLHDSQLNRHFSVFVRQGNLYQSEWAKDEAGKDVFRDTQRVEWLVGAGANGIGAFVRLGNRVFEAPLSYYATTRAWGVSPGYEQSDRGFSRPIDAACITCHSGRPNPVRGNTGEFRDPLFDELAIGCENCHGPGAAHVAAMRKQPAARASPASDPTIIDPGKLTPWLADNICMSCHQTGDARVLQPSKAFGDFRPGQPLDATLAILMAPPTRENPPRSDLVQQYFSMRLSKCYGSSGGKLSCITCHNPHVQPSRDEAPSYYRGKCLICHTESSCTLPLAARQQSTPPDDCAGCHMPKRTVTGISHASLANHRIVATPDEPFPDATFEMTTASLPDLVHIDAIPGQPDNIARVTLLQAYGNLSVDHPEYLQRYFDLGKQLESSESNDTNVLEALAAQAFQLRTQEGDAGGIAYLKHAIAQGSATAWDFETLGSRLLRAHQLDQAVACLRKGIERAPYDPKLYTLLAEGYAAMNRPAAATATLNEALRLFPEMDLLRAFIAQIQHRKPPAQNE